MMVLIGGSRLFSSEISLDFVDAGKTELVLEVVIRG